MQYDQPRSGGSKASDEELLLQKKLEWHNYCKQFVNSAVEVLIQARMTSFGHPNPDHPLKLVLTLIGGEIIPTIVWLAR